MTQESRSSPLLFSVSILLGIFLPVPLFPEKGKSHPRLSWVPRKRGTEGALGRGVGGCNPLSVSGTHCSHPSNGGREFPGLLRPFDVPQGCRRLPSPNPLWARRALQASVENISLPHSNRNHHVGGGALSSCDPVCKPKA